MIVVVRSVVPRASALVAVRDEAKRQLVITDEPFYKALPKWEWGGTLTLCMKMTEGLTLTEACKSMHGETGT